MRQQGLGRVERPAVPARVPVGVPEVPADADAARWATSSSSSYLSPMRCLRLVGVGADLQLDRDAHLRGVLAAPLPGPREEGDGLIDQVRARVFVRAGGPVDVHDGGVLLQAGGLGGQSEGNARAIARQGLSSSEEKYSGLKMLPSE